MSKELSILKRSIRDEYVYNKSFSRTMQVLANILIKRKESLRLAITESGESKTDCKTYLDISLPDNMLKAFKEDIKANKDFPRILYRGLCAHECEHVNSSNMEIRKAICEEIVSDYKKNDIPEIFSKEYAAAITNIIEDGRIERRVSNRNPGVLPALNYINGFIYKTNICNGEFLEDLMAATLTIAKVNLLPSNWGMYHQNDELDILMRQGYDIIRAGVLTDSLYEWKKRCMAYHDLFMPYIIRHLDKDLLNDIDRLLNLLKKLVENSLFGRDDVNGSNFAENDVVGNAYIPGFGDDKKDKTLSETELETQLENLKDDLMPSALKEKEDEKRRELLDKKAWSEKYAVNLDEISTKHQADVYDASRKTHDGLNGPLLEEGKKLKRNFEEILSSKAKIKTDRLKRGKLDVHAVPRLIANQDKKIFYDYDEDNEFENIEDIVFYLIIDQSASFEGEKLQEAKNAAAVLEYSLKDLVPLKIIGYNSTVDSTAIYIYKDFNQNTRHSLIHIPMEAKNNNCDNYVLRYAFQDLLRRNEKRKIILTITDGMPSLSMDRTVDVFTEVKNTIRVMERKGINVFPIAICPNIAEYRQAFESLYIQGASLSTPEGLMKYLVRTIRTRLSEL